MHPGRLGWEGYPGVYTLLYTLGVYTSLYTLLVPPVVRTASLVPPTARHCYDTLPTSRPGVMTAFRLVLSQLRVFIQV